MDSRCPRQLTELPCSYCPLAVQRLKALRHAGRELTEEEEEKQVGCRFAVNHQLANYCMFSLLENFLPDDKGFSEMEVAHFCNISVDTVRKTEKKAIQKMHDSSEFQEIIEVADGDQIMEDTDSDPEWELPS